MYSLIENSNVVGWQSPRPRSGYLAALLLWLVIAVSPTHVVAQEDVQAWVELNIDAGEDLISVPGYDSGSGWQTQYQQSGYWTFSRTDDSHVRLFASALRDPSVKAPSVANVRGSGYAICYDGHARRWETDYQPPVEVAPGSLSATATSNRVSIWYSVPTVWMQHPGDNPGSSECYSSDPHRAEMRLHTADLENDPAEVNRYGEFLVSTFHWNDIVDAADDRTPPLTFNAVYESSDEYGRVWFRIRGFIHTVPVRIEGPRFTTEGLQSEEFMVSSPPPDQVESYRWEITWPEGVGHTPHLMQFTNPADRSTTIEQAKWYALPDSRWMRDTHLSANYEVVAYVTVDGTEYRSSAHPWTVEVQYGGEILERAPWYRDRQSIIIEQSETDSLWYVTGQGDFRRLDTFTPIVFLPPASDFYVKTEAHENHHVLQFTALEPWITWWDVNTLFRETLLDLPGQSTWSEMFDLAMSTVRRWGQEDLERYAAHQCRMEADAFEAEYGIGPAYLEMDESDIPHTYDCSF